MSRCAPARRRRRYARAGTAGSRGWTSPTATGYRWTSWCSRPGSGPATSSPGRPGWRSASAAGSSSTTRARPAPRTCTPSARWPASRAAPGAWSGPATRWPRSWWTGCSAASATFPGADMSTKLKLLGVDVASFGDVFAYAPGSLEVVYADPVAGVYKKLVLSDDAQTLLGGVLVGDASAYASLRPMVGSVARLGPDLLAAAGGLGARGRARTCPTRPPSAPATTSPPARSAQAVSEQRLHRPRRGEGVHQGRHQLRVLPAAGEEADDRRAGEVRGRGQQRALRALRASAGPSCSTSSG